MEPIFLAGIGLLSLGGVLLLYAKQKIDTANYVLKESKSRLKSTKREMEAERREAALKLKDELYKKRKEFELEVKRERLELSHLHTKLNTKYEDAGKKEHEVEELQNNLQQKERELSRSEDVLRANETKLKNLYNTLLSKLEQVSKITKEEAKQTLLDTLDAEVRLANQKWIQKVEDEARSVAKRAALDILVSAMQRHTADYVASRSSSTVQLPSEDMKGRIIGKEGRNIKALEMATGMEFIIEEGSDSITISGFHPVRREIARRALERLVTDGRINPTRIEDTVEQCERELKELIQEYGNEVILEYNLQGIHPDMVTLLGTLHFRTSFSQNVLQHSKEVGLFARMIAQELGLDGAIAFRAGLLHDIGKAVSAEVEGPHAQIGADIAKRCGEDPIIINAIAAHHEEVPFSSIYSLIVVIADTMSASRPGARRETLTAYIKRLEQLEEIATSFEGVKKAYALQAGREVRIIVDEDHIDDEEAAILARDIAKRVEEEMNFPGQIKVNVIREKRSIEYAR
jgi:ribonucrease Y